MPHYIETFICEIIKLSKTNTWDDAKYEWQVLNRYKCDFGAQRCLCGHRIGAVVVLYNPTTKQKVEVGNVCVKKFLDFGKKTKIMKMFRLIEADIEQALDKPSINYAYQHQWINDWERKFLLSTERFPITELSTAQTWKRIEINKIVVGEFQKPKQIPKAEGKVVKAQRCSVCSVKLSTGNVNDTVNK
uniref:Uncharacterized protein n=1 Tax=Panagrellus redivivus TaxID=6233 RepID=A0A7E4V4A8_PANRE